MYCKRVLLKLGLKKINDLFNTKTNSRISQAKLNLKQGIYFIKKKKQEKDSFSTAERQASQNSLPVFVSSFFFFSNFERFNKKEDVIVSYFAFF